MCMQFSPTLTTFSVHFALPWMPVLSVCLYMPTGIEPGPQQVFSKCILEDMFSSN